ncbi:hypothetical protein N5I72_17855, partial [Klebsiella variicola]|uniref:hypothetical protein n=1 Tax=Klebsiella variicola TaxID=244366 RepID=UPI0022462371
IVKEQLQRGFQLTVARSRIIRFPHAESSAYFAFLCRFSALNFIAGTPLTRRLACRCSVSVEAHYREF